MIANPPGRLTVDFKNASPLDAPPDLKSGVKKNVLTY